MLEGRLGDRRDTTGVDVRVRGKGEEGGVERLREEVSEKDLERVPTE